MNDIYVALTMANWRVWLKCCNIVVQFFTRYVWISFQLKAWVTDVVSSVPNAVTSEIYCAMINLWRIRTDCCRTSV